MPTNYVNYLIYYLCSLLPPMLLLWRHFVGGWADRLIAQTCQARKFFNGILVAFKPIYVAKDSELIIIISSDILMDPTQLTELTDSHQKNEKTDKTKWDLNL